MMKALAIALGEVGRSKGRDDRDNLTNVQCKAIQNHHNEKRNDKEIQKLNKKAMTVFNLPRLKSR
jgi:hypothetical protein